MEHDDETCRKIFEDLSAYLDGELTPERCKEVARHFDHCEACRSYLASLRATRESINVVGRLTRIGQEEAGEYMRECLEALHRKIRALSGGSEGSRSGSQSRDD